MADEPAPLAHLLRAAEELLRAGAEGAALMRQWLERTEGSPAGAAEPLLRVLLLRLAASAAEALPEVREALAAQARRFAALAGEDPGAARVRDVFQALLRALETSLASAPPRTAPRRAPARRRTHD